VLLSIAGGSDLGLFEVSAAADLIQAAAHEEANIIFGTVIDDALGDEVRVTVIAAGFEDGHPPRRQPGIGRAPSVRGGQSTSLGGTGNGGAGIPSAPAKQPTGVPAGSPSAGGSPTPGQPTGSPAPAQPNQTGSAAPRPAGPTAPAGQSNGGRPSGAQPFGGSRPSAQPSAEDDDDLDVPDFLK
jgi:cell division protein FtsZ